MNRWAKKIVWLIIFCVQASFVMAGGTVYQVTAEIFDSKTRILIGVSGGSPYTVIHLGDREILAAFKDATLEPGASTPKIKKGTLISDILIEQKRSKVVSVLARLAEPAQSITHYMNAAGAFLVVEIAFAQKEKTKALPAPKIHKPAPSGLEKKAPKEKVKVKKAVKQKKSENKKPSIHKVLLQDKYENPARNDDALLRKVWPGSKAGDHGLFAKAVEHYNKERWGRAISGLEDLLRLYPKSGYEEQAIFLLARAYHQLYAHDLPGHVVEISEKYRRAIKRFPVSAHVPEALVHLAGLYLDASNYPEAAAYCELVWDRHKTRAMSPDFLLLKGRALVASGRKSEAARALDMLIGYFPGSPYVAQAHFEKAKILFEEKFFKQSLAALTSIVDENPNAAYKYPTLLYYRGENLYQLRRLPEARKAFFKAYNIFPDSDLTDVILTRIGDTFTEQGKDALAAQLYRVVMENCPDTDGRLISLVRLADYMDANPGGKVFENKTALDIHLEIVKKHGDHPLAQMSMLKLARIYHNKKQYEKAVSVLQNLLSMHPFTKLHEDVKAALLASVEAIFLRDNKSGNYKKIVEYYDKVRDLMPFDEMPHLLLIVGNAYGEIGMCSWAVSVLEYAGKFYPDTKPARLMLTMGNCCYKLGKFDKATLILEGLILQYPQDPNFEQVHHILAQLYLNQKEYEKAVNSLLICTRSNAAYCQDYKLLSVLGYSLKKIKKPKEAITALKRALAAVPESEPLVKRIKADIYEELGDAHIDLNGYLPAVKAFEKALTMEKNPALEFKAARCHLFIGDKDKAAQILKTLAESDSGVWSRAAQTRLNQARAKNAWKKSG